MNIVYSPLHTVLAAGVLLIIPVVFHLIAFRKSIRFIHILTSILVGNFILAFVLEIAGLAHFFDGRVILTISLLIAGVSGYWINKKGFFYNKNITGNNISKTSIMLVFGFAIFLFLYQKNTFPPFTPDTLGAYLPWARIIVNECAIPAFHLETNALYGIYTEHFLYTNIAFLFSLFGEYADSIAAAIPLIYLCFFIFLITNWGKEFKDRCVPLFILLALLLAPPSNFVYIGTRLLKEAPVLLFATATFYFFFKYMRTRETVFLVLLAISSSLMSLTKYSGFAISAILFCFLIIGTREKKELRDIFTIFPLLYIPPILWGIRNFYYFSNPVYPYFRSIFGGIYLGPAPIVPPSGAISNLFQCVFEGAVALGYYFIFFPAFLFTLIYLFRNRKKVEVLYVLTSFIVFLILLKFGHGINRNNMARYLTPFLGIFVLYAGIEMSKLYDKIPFEVIKKKKKAILSIAIILCCMMHIMVPIPGIYLSDIKSGDYRSVMSDLNLSNFDPMQPCISRDWTNKMDVVEYLQNKEDTDLIIVGLSDVDRFTWYGGYTALNPRHDGGFIVLNYIINKEPFNFSQGSTYIYNNFKSMDIDYVYDHPKSRKDNLHKIFYNKINQNQKHFELVYDKNGYKLWEVR